MVTHDRDLACGIAHRVAFMYDGLVRFLGTPAELRACTDPIVQSFLTIDFDAQSPPSNRHEKFPQTRLGLFFALASSRACWCLNCPEAWISSARALR